MGGTQFRRTYYETVRFPEEVQDEVLARLRRAEGQLRGVQRLIEDGADCKDVVTQLTAAQAALHRAGLRLMASGMRHCLADPQRAEAEGMTPEAMEELFLKLR
ncbi:MAG: metal-sensitive transcriptional regulator [Acidimicrobiales bacterium]|nr:metal-sensitive transcriptional regulator [Acidimicrobiales bacterium]